jgi:hypothetical protein
MNMEKNKYITVSDNFVETYKMFNVIKQTEKLNQLSRKELMLMLVLAIDSFSEENPAVLENFKEFKNELELVFDLQQDKECTDEDLLQLGKDTDEKYIDTSKIRDKSDQELPSPLSDAEALQMRRDIGINNIID